MKPETVLPPSILLVAIVVACKAACAADRSSKVDYARDVRPILSRCCFQCHGPDEKTRQAELRLDDRSQATRELGSGKRAVVPGQPDHSELVRRITSADPQLQMPPSDFGSRLTDTEKSVLTTWIEQQAEYARHWAYVKPVRPTVPQASDPKWVTNEIDAFILDRLNREGLHQSPSADRSNLLRRAALDLTGLPPTPDEVKQFRDDPRPDAYLQAIDHLLAKPAYGERWAAVWLDLARYGDSQGYIHDPPRTIWRWRDWLIESLNSNQPYDQFTIEMLAGDLLPGATTSQQIATGFHRNTTNNTEGGSNTEEYRHASVVDRVNTTMQVWMGTTFGCAQCHSHKFDPFSQTEYYQVFAIFNATEDNNSEAPTIDAAYPGYEADRLQRVSLHNAATAKLDEVTGSIDPLRDEWEKTVDRATLAAEIKDILEVETDKRTKKQADQLIAFHRGQFPEFTARQAEVQAAKRELDKVATTTLVMKEVAARTTHVAVRGEFQQRGDIVQPGVPAVLHAVATDAKLDRLGLARWIVDPNNPLTARVAVNRLWQELFGVGIVESAEEFGNQGDSPSHPELLDWLADEFIRTGWDTKRLLRTIVTSSAYQQTSQVSDELAARDPYNRLLSRGPRVRLPAETVRDQALFAAGLLSQKMYGPPVHPPQPVNGLAAAFGPSTDWETSRGEDRHRRALYTRWRRNLPYASMITFDAPERSVCSLRRIRTNTPLQALVTLNDQVYVEAAQALARRLISDGGSTTAARAQYGFELTLCRAPTDAEQQRIVALYESVRAELAADPGEATALATKPIGALPATIDSLDAAAWTVVGNVLLNLDEFLAKP